MAIGGIQDTFDIQQYVTQLMEYEKRSLYALQDRKKNMEGQISAWDRINASLKKLQTTLNTLQKSSTFGSMLATSSDSSFVSAVAGVNSAETTYTFSNITLARAASTTSTAGLGLSSGTAASITSGEEINTTGGQDADPNATISGGNINLDAGKSIVSGSFYVNNKEIEVTANDTIYTILSKINSSGANVVATFENDTVSITQKTVGIAYSVRLSGDTTGFLDAMKLASGTEDPDPAYGVSHDYDLDIIDSTLSGSVSDGYFNINGITFSVDVDNDSLSDIINRINASDAGVLAYYDSVDDKITLTSVVGGQDIALANDTAGFFSALNVSVETYGGTDSTFDLNGQTMTRSSNTFGLNGTTFTLRSSTAGGETVTVTVEKDAQKIEDAVQDFVDQHNETIGLIKEEAGADKPLENNQRLKSILRRLRTMAASTISNDGNLNHLSEIGVTLNHSGSEKTLSLNTTVLAEAIEENVSDVFSLFAINTDADGKYDDGGFSVSLDDYLDVFTERFDGYVVAHNDFIRDSIERLDRRIEREEEKMDRREAQLIDEYSQLQEAIRKLDSLSYSAVSIINQFSSYQ